MDTMEQRSIETTLIKISVRTAWYIFAAVVIGVVWGTMLYNGIMDGQKELLQALKDQSRDTQYQIQDVKKDIGGMDQRLTKLEAVK